MILEEEIFRFFFDLFGMKIVKRKREKKKKKKKTKKDFLPFYFGG